MNPIFMQQMAEYRRDDLARDAEANRAARRDGASRGRILAIRPRLVLTAGRLRLVIRGSAA